MAGTEVAIEHAAVVLGGLATAVGFLWRELSKANEGRRLDGQAWTEKYIALSREGIDAQNEATNVILDLAKKLEARGGSDGKAN